MEKWKLLEYYSLEVIELLINWLFWTVDSIEFTFPSIFDHVLDSNDISHQPPAPKTIRIKYLLWNEVQMHEKERLTKQNHFTEQERNILDK